MSHVDATQEPRRRTRAARIGRGVLLALASASVLLQLAVGGAVVWAVQNPRTVADHWTVARFEAPAEVVALANRAAMSDRGRFLFSASEPAIVPATRFDEVCSYREPGIGVLGCYTLDEGRIYLFPIGSTELEGLQVVVAAHEMLHAAWDRLGAAEQAALADPLEEAFASLGPDHELVERIALYEEADPGSRIPELYAILGTEVGELPPVLTEHYAGYFDDRTAVTSLYARASAVFESLDERLTALDADLSELFVAIETDQADYEEAADALASDIEDFNDRASTPGAFPSDAAFDEERAEIIARQEALEADRQAINDAVDEYNRLLGELEQLNAEAAELNRAINIDLDPLDETDAEPGDVDS